MRIIAIQKDASEVNKREFVPHLRDEARKGWELYKNGFLREVYYKADRPEVVLILECEDVEQAKEKLGMLPLVKEGLIAFDFIPLKPYHGYERLFEKK